MNIYLYIPSHANRYAREAATSESKRGIEMVANEKKFKIEATARQTFYFEVEAKNEKEAIKKFKELGFSCGEEDAGNYSDLDMDRIEEIKEKEGASPSSKGVA